MRGIRAASVALVLLAQVSMVWGQGIASRGVTATKRDAPSGRPWLARFTDIATEAGLVHPTIYGNDVQTTYLLETSSGGVALFDYDNDGLLDIFLVSGTRLEGEVEGATNRLYRNRGDGTFEDVTDKAGLRRQGWAFIWCRQHQHILSAGRATERVCSQPGPCTHICMLRRCPRLGGGGWAF